MPNRPEVSVIVGAYNRQKYLPIAVRSLLAQTLERDRFEVVVIKNFWSEAGDRELAEVGATVLFDDERRIGRWLRHAVRVARAPIITFCDDDDEFEPARLARVLEAFGEHPDLGFYRNRVTVIDAEGRPTPPAQWRSHEVDVGFDTLGPVYRPAGEKADLLDLATSKTHATFGTSTMALRRELLDGELGDAFERTQLEDLFLFLTGALSPSGVFLDDRRLTRYRFYAGNVTHVIRWLDHATKSERDMAEIAARHGRPDFAGWLTARAVNHERLYLGGSLVEQVGAGAPRRDAAHRTAEYLRFLARHPEERAWTLDTWAAGIYGLSYLAVPPLARRVARARLAARAVN
ncbi:MAG TPA: glycosyltransferase family 2 protein [Thermoplasmata archaeon]|nr:glycosyltransferase family 2 protein [Thermoplasmata archaeon]